MSKENYLSLADLSAGSGASDPHDVVLSWMQSTKTIAFLGLWEHLNNPDFIFSEFEQLKNKIGVGSFFLTPRQWKRKTNAIGLIQKTENGTEKIYAHEDIALEFAEWLSPELRLQTEKKLRAEKEAKSQGRRLIRSILKMNHTLYVEAIKKHLITSETSPKEERAIIIRERAIINKALFGKTDLEWQKENPSQKGSMRDNATKEQLTILLNLETANSIYIEQGLPESERSEKLKEMAKTQTQILKK